jgi:DNA-directed RNA polymerase specialized sigma24 family protein
MKSMTVEDLLDEVVRLLALQVRLGLDNQSRAILELNRAGFANARAAALLGTTPDTVKVTVARARRKETGK